MQPDYRTRFAPSPTGPLHLGHAFSALTAWGRAQAVGGDCLLRMEDIDTARCKPQWEAAIYDDLAWLGLSWPRPVWRQSERRAVYDATLSRLIALGLCYPCRCRRSDIRAALSAPQEAPASGRASGLASGPDGPVYPGTCRNRAMAEAGPGDAIRLNIAHACDLIRPRLAFQETGENAGRHEVRCDHIVNAIGDVVLARRDIGTSYHVAVVTDDAAQGVTEVVRGMDLFDVTPLHVVLQTVLGLPVPAYHHHRLIRDATGKRLAKRSDAMALARYRSDGLTPDDIRALIGLA